ncbi:linear amide C-N hydrolase [Micromonospora echinofusca]|uniref:Linear amide C-N hydrolase n=1 Tax=Micromonospora echinofusca TaxID=47858 RepID=A0ABS3VYF4_MICEH|nr:linear amide C-N hydrolase [Micromonospora echinofusca]
MRRRVVLAGVLLLAMAGCADGAAAPTAATTPAGPGGTPDGAAATAPVGSSRQTPAEIDRTLASLRRVDDLPLYEMTYTGDYDPTTGLDPAPTSPFGCSLFVASGDRDRPLFARNFDWDPHPAMLLRTDPPDGYASVSVVDLHYLGIDGAPQPGDRRLLDAPLLPFDGMNERGLAIGLAADDTATATPEPGKPKVGSVRIQRLVLDQAATVDEAVAIFGRYNLDFEGGPPLHYLLADASGASAVVEFVDGRMRVQRGTGPWQALTNVPVIGVPADKLRTDRRYATIEAALTRSGGRADATAALGILTDVAQSHTRWSVTYELRTGAVRLVAGQRWAKTYQFQLAGS